MLRGASDVIDKRVIPRVVNSLATRLGDAGDWNSVAGDRVRVGPRAVVKLPYVVQGNDVLRWEFCVRAHDVRFSVSERRMASGGAVEVGLLPSATFAAGSKFGGAWTAKDHTTLLLVFDNAYSLVTAKDVAVAAGARRAEAAVGRRAAARREEAQIGGAGGVLVVVRGRVGVVVVSFCELKLGKKPVRHSTPRPCATSPLAESAR